MVRKIIYNEDCRETIKKLDNVDYIFTVPPDFEELDLTPFKDDDVYYGFLQEVFLGLTEISDTITVAITDRKFKAQIVPKHTYIIDWFLINGYNLVSHKIWQKTEKINLYRLTYTHVMTFSGSKPKQAWQREFMYDIFTDTEEKFEKYPYGIALGVVEKCIRNFTKEGDVVYDPFMGSGTTAVACLNNKRDFIGSEINEEYYKLAEKRWKMRLDI